MFALPQKRRKKFLHSQEQGRRFQWPSSFDIFDDWLSTGNNYARWQGDGNDGVTIKTLEGEITAKMKKGGIYYRIAKGIILFR